jgi:ribosomal protein S8
MQFTRLSNFLSTLLKNSQQFKPTYTCNYLTKSILLNIKLLLYYNIINGYTIQPQLYPKIRNRYTVKIYLKYIKESLCFRDLRIFSKISRPYFMTLKDIKKLTKKSFYPNYIFVFSTSSGYLTASECLQQRTAGILLYRVSI